MNNLATVMRLNPNEKEEFFEAVKGRFEKYTDVYVIKDDFRVIPEAESLNRAIASMPPHEFILIIDADEYICEDDVGYMVSVMRKNGKSIGMVPMIEYTKENEAVIERDHAPIVIIRPGVKFYDNRCAQGDMERIPGVYLHHFSFMCEKTARKLDTHWDDRERKGIAQALNLNRRQIVPPPEVVSIFNAVYHLTKENNDAGCASSDKRGKRRSGRTSGRNKPVGGQPDPAGPK